MASPEHLQLGPVNRILIIDDDAELCALVARYLTREGFGVERAADGNQGIGMALSGSYALIMLDVMMPDLNGFDVLRRIRASSRTPVLMLTARGDTHDRVFGLELGADDYLPKPYDSSELAERLESLVGSHMQSRRGLSSRMEARLAR